MRAVSRAAENSSACFPRRFDSCGGRAWCHEKRGPHSPTTARGREQGAARTSTRIHSLRRASRYLQPATHHAPATGKEWMGRKGGKETDG
jgi:hypothetical protein